MKWIFRDLRLSLLMDKYFTPTEKFSVISQITFEEMKTFCVQFLEKLYVKALVQGNVDKDTALRVIEKFISDLSYAPLEKKLYPQVFIEIFKQIFSFHSEICCSSKFGNCPKEKNVVEYSLSTKMIPIPLLPIIISLDHLI